jgi:hypothetical protein
MIGEKRSVYNNRHTFRPFVGMTRIRFKGFGTFIALFVAKPALVLRKHKDHLSRTQKIRHPSDISI